MLSISRRHSLVSISGVPPAASSGKPFLGPVEQNPEAMHADVKRQRSVEVHHVQFGDELGGWVMQLTELDRESGQFRAKLVRRPGA
jgi:hypothetical protein